jgi:hypothetical protein
MKKNSFLLFFLLTLASQAQEKPSLKTTHPKSIEAQSAVVIDNQSTIADPIIRPKNELPISTKTNPEVFFIEKEKPKAESVKTKYNSIQVK